MINEIQELRYTPNLANLTATAGEGILISGKIPAKTYLYPAVKVRFMACIQ